MKLSYLLFLLLFTGSNYCVSAQEADKIVGRYWSPKKDGQIEIYRQGNKYYGKIIAPKSGKDIKNPNPNLRSRDILGMIFLYDFVYDDEEYIDGTIYDPQSGKTYSSKMWLDGTSLKLRGYIGMSLFGRTETFERIR